MPKAVAIETTLLAVHKLASDLFCGLLPLSSNIVYSVYFVGRDGFMPSRCHQFEVTGYCIIQIQPVIYYIASFGNWFHPLPVAGNTLSELQMEVEGDFLCL